MSDKFNGIVRPDTVAFTLIEQTERGDVHISHFGDAGGILRALRDKVDLKGLRADKDDER